jgi:hypothetical protein
MILTACLIFIFIFIAAFVLGFLALWRPPKVESRPLVEYADVPWLNGKTPKYKQESK